MFGGKISFVFEEYKRNNKLLTYFQKKVLLYRRKVFQICNQILQEFRESYCTYSTLPSWHLTNARKSQLLIFETGSTALNSFCSELCLTASCKVLAIIQHRITLAQLVLAPYEERYPRMSFTKHPLKRVNLEF
jgi:hypothetical protein